MYKARILIVEDDEVNRELLDSILKVEYSLDFACDGKEALGKIEANPKSYDLMLLDLYMPVMDGYELLEIMKERDYTKNFPVVVISADSAKDSIGRAFELGAMDYFEKPIDSQIITSHVHNMIALCERANVDYVTGGYNRNGFIEMVERYLSARENWDPYAVLFFNIKNFKAVNEIYGIEEGDKVLQKFFYELKTSQLKPIFISRIEGDHFVTFCHRKNMDLQRISNRCQETIELKGNKMRFYINFGVYYLENDKIPVSSMIDRAKYAMEYIVDEHVKPYSIYDNTMRANYVDRAAFATELADALEKEQFKVFYQPVMDAATGNLVTAEALVRWQHPTKGFISPGVFLPIIEQDGHISELDWYVTKKVAEMIKERTDAGLPVVPVSVNLSWMDFYDEKNIEKILDFFRQEVIPRGMIRFEITETSYASLNENRSEILDTMRALGIKLYLDDFGSGYSSFGMIKDYNFDILKIDMSFTRQIEKHDKVRSILRAIIDMCHQLGIKVVAEGAETEEQVEFLRSRNCNYIQGYYYSKPIPEKEFLDFVDKNAAEYRITKWDGIDNGILRTFFKEGVNYVSYSAKQKSNLDEKAITSVLKDNSAVGIVSGQYDADYSLYYASDIFLRLLGYTFEKFLRACHGEYLALVDPKDREYFASTSQEPSRSYHLLTADGKSVHVQETKEDVCTDDGTRQWIAAIRAI